MSTTYSASVVFGYLLAADELVKRISNPLWGKVKFDPDTGVRVPQFIETEIVLKIKDDSYDEINPGEVARYNAGESVILGVELADAGDLGYGDATPERFAPMVGTDFRRIEKEIKQTLTKAGLAFDETKMGHYLVGSVH